MELRILACDEMSALLRPHTASLSPHSLFQEEYGKV
jgi:hypothetical protein